MQANFAWPPAEFRGPSNGPAQVIITGHAFQQNLRRGHDELGIDVPTANLAAAAFDDLAQAI